MPIRVVRNRQQTPVSGFFRASNFGDRRASGRAQSSCNPRGASWSRANWGGGQCGPFSFQAGGAAGLDDMLRQLQRDMERWNTEYNGGQWDAQGAPRSPAIPLPVDSVEEEDAFVYYADLPGISKSDVKLQINKERVMTIGGERKSPAAAAQEGEQPERRRRRAERRMGKFERRIQLPKNADLSSIKARTDNGVLTVRVGKVQPSEPEVTDIPINGDWPSDWPSEPSTGRDSFDV